MLFLFQSCHKEIKVLNQNTPEQYAISEVQKIVGNEGNVFVITNLSSNKKNSVNINGQNIVTVNLEKFKDIVNQLKSDTLPHNGIKYFDSVFIDNVKIKIAALNSFDEWDGPKPAGMYRYYFGPLQNGNSSFLTNLNISFNTNQDGSMHGSPSIYFSGITLFGWQPQQISSIAYNASNYVSTFAITGTTTFGIQCSGGLTIGWTSTITFYVRISMDENDANPVEIRGYK